jgi:hypothetical protein
MLAMNDETGTGKEGIAGGGAASLTVLAHGAAH